MDESEELELNKKVNSRGAGFVGCLGLLVTAIITIPCGIMTILVILTGIFYNHEETTAKVVGYNEERGVIWDSYVVPVLEFEYQGMRRTVSENADDLSFLGKQIQYAIGFWPKVGEAVTVTWISGQSEKYEKFEIKNLWARWIYPFVLIVSIVIFRKFLWNPFSKNVDFRVSKENEVKNKQGKKLNLSISEFFHIPKESIGRSGIFYPRGYTFCCQWTDPLTHKKYKFYSKKVLYHPAALVEEGRKVEVHIYEQDPTIYSLDDSFMPKLSIDCSLMLAFEFRGYQADEGWYGYKSIIDMYYDKGEKVRAELELKEFSEAIKLADQYFLAGEKEKCIASYKAILEKYFYKVEY